MTCHVLEEDPAGLQDAYGVCDEGPEVPLIFAAFPFACGAERLTRITSCQPVDRLNVMPVGGGDVMQVGDVGPVMGEDFGRRIIELGVPCDRAVAEMGEQPEVEASHAAAEAADSHRVLSRS
jgi:hypothetical protein